MGASLPRACDSAVIERLGSKHFNVAVAEVNGFRTAMEDAHLIYVKDEVAVFGVYDGHGGKECSKFCAERIHEELEKSGIPEDDAAWEKLFIRIDELVLEETNLSSGTTATMCVVYKPSKAGEKHRLHVINAGDSRTILGKADGSIFDGGGTDKGLTRDHKPEDPEERARIEAAGAVVESDRVNGNLSVCRGFGDRDEKQTGGPGPDNRPVTCIPEQYHFECDETDFVLLVCDGVSEGRFSNEEVVKFVADNLKDGKDSGETARLVCLEAIKKDSKDNITCMIVQLQGVAEAFDRKVDFVPGSVSKLSNSSFRNVYEFMAAKANLSLEQAVARRYEFMQEEIKAAPEPTPQELLDEAEMLGNPPGEPDSEERLEWAANWLKEHSEEQPKSDGQHEFLTAMINGQGNGGADASQMVDLLQNIIMSKGKGKGKGRGRGSGSSNDARGY